MFTTNFFNDNSQLNYGRHLTHDVELNEERKKELGHLIDDVHKDRFKKNKIADEKLAIFRSLGLLIAMGLTVMAFEWKSYDKAELITLNSIEINSDEILDIPLTQQPPPPAPKKMPVTIVEVPDVEEIEEEIDIDLDIETNEDMVMEEVAYEQIEEVEEENSEEIFLIVEDKPQPAGGMHEFYQYIANEINYPAAALRANIGGKVFVQFVVNKDGSLTDFQVVKGIGLGCDEEALRVLQKAPNWVPGKQRGKAVRVRMILPINFILRDNS